MTVGGESAMQFAVRKLSMRDLIDCALEATAFVVETAPHENARERLIDVQGHLQDARRLLRQT